MQMHVVHIQYSLQVLHVASSAVTIAVHVLETACNLKGSYPKTQQSSRLKLNLIVQNNNYATLKYLSDCL